MTLARWQATVVDESGNIQVGASIEVRLETAGSLLAPLYSDRAGATPLANPFTADSEGFAAFHVAGGAYRITATLGAFSRVWRYVGIGTAAEYDSTDITALVQNVDAGYALTFESETVVPPSAGAIRFNNASLAIATEAYVSTENLAGSDIESRLLELFDSGRTIKDVIIVSDVINNLQASFYVSNTTLNSGYVTVSLTNHSGETSFTDGYHVNFQRERAGADGLGGGLAGAGNGNTIARQIAIFTDTTGATLAGADDGSSPTDPLTIDEVLSAINAKQDASANLAAWSSIDPSSINFDYLIAIIEDRKSDNVDGGTFTSGAWQTRTLNTLVYNLDTIVSLSANVFTLPAGTYFIKWSAPGFTVDSHQSALFLNDNTPVAYGTSELAANGQVTTHSFGSTVVTIGTSTDYKVVHRCQSTRATDGFGIGSAFGVGEVYARVEIRKIV